MYYSHLVMPGSGEAARPRVIKSEQIDRVALAKVVCCIKTGDWSSIEAGTGLRIVHTRDPDHLSVWAGESPIMFAMYLPEASLEDLREWHSTIVSMFTVDGIEPLANWMDMVTDYPAMIECVIPNGSQAQRGIVGALATAWGWAIMESTCP